MFDTRYLGDTSSDLTAAVRATVAALDPPATDYARGFLRGWTRSFTKHWSVFFSNPVPGMQQGPQPTVAEWNAFDQEAHRLGVDQATLATRYGAAESAKRSGFFTKIVTAARPVTEPLATVEKTLDTYVPGWTVLLNGISPLVPFVPLLTTVLAAASNLDQGLVTDALSRAVANLAKPGISRENRVTLPTGAQRTVSLGFVAAAQNVLVQGAAAIAPMQASIRKITQTFVDAKGPLLAKLQAAALEAFAEYKLGVKIACTLATAGACAGLDLLVSALDTAITVAQAQDAARRLKNEADAARKRAALESAQLDTELAQIQAEIDRLRSLLHPAAVAGGHSSLLLLGAAGLAGALVAELAG